jgi:tRNA 2-thiouridine synthesizing protein B
MRVFLLTKTPNSERTKICLRLVASSVDAIVYLAGDGVYNLLGQGEARGASQAGQALAALAARDRILACREDLEARGISAEGKATVPADFYECLVGDMMREGSQVYSF